MRSRWMTAVVAPTLALTLSCSDSTGPDPELERLILAFCSTELPTWFAYQNEGGDWTRVQPTASNAFEFDATPRVAIALTQQFSNEFFTDVYYTTVDEIRPLSGIACTETLGNKTVNGTVANVPVGSQASISLSGANDVVTPPASTSYTLSGVASNPQDLVAHREVVSGTSPPTPNRVIIRRALDAVNNSSLSVLDFGNEGQAAATHTATITGLIAGQENYYFIDFSTASGTDHALYTSPTFTNSSQTLYGVPSGLTQTGDAHRLEFNADATNSYRTVVHWTRIPGDKAFTLGPALSLPSVTKVSSTPYARLRISLAAQSDYPSFVTAFFFQGATRQVNVTLTAAHVNGPVTTWANEIPDFTAAGGYPSGAGLQNNTSTDWFVEAYDGSLPAFVGGTPVDGATVKYAGRANVTSTMQMNAAGARRAPAMREQLFRRALTQ